MSAESKNSLKWLPADYYNPAMGAIEGLSIDLETPSPGIPIEAVNLNERIQELAEEYVNSPAVEEIKQIDRDCEALMERRNKLRSAQQQVQTALYQAVKQANKGKINGVAIQVGEKVLVWIGGAMHVVEPQRFNAKEG